MLTEEQKRRLQECVRLLGLKDQMANAAAVEAAALTRQNLIKQQNDPDLDDAALAKQNQQLAELQKAKQDYLNLTAQNQSSFTKKITYTLNKGISLETVKTGLDGFIKNLSEELQKDIRYELNQHKNCITVYIKCSNTGQLANKLENFLVQSKFITSASRKEEMALPGEFEQSQSMDKSRASIKPKIPTPLSTRPMPTGAGS